ILSFLLWVVMLIVTAIFLRKLRTKTYIIATGIFFIMAIYLGFFSVYGGHEGWISDYYDAVLKINRR
ncbi:MAG TPA: hypothetical protein VFZ33_11135, partial [Chitinophagaceae bacterium]